MMPSAIERRTRPARRGGRRPARRARAGGLVAAGHGCRLAHPPAVSRGAGGGTDRRPARATPTRSASCAPMRDAWPRSERDRQALQGRGGRGDREDRADLPRAGAGAGRAGRRGGAARRRAGGRRLCRLVPAVGRGQAAGRDQSCRSRAPGPAGRAGGAAPSDRPPAVVARCLRRPSRRRSQQAEAPPIPAISPSSAARRRSVPPPFRQQSGQSRIVLRASADAWVQVRDRAGPVLLNRILHPGETWPVPARPNLLLTTGQRRRHRLLVDGVATPVAGRQRRGAARPAAGPRPDQGRQAGGQHARGANPQ